MFRIFNKSNLAVETLSWGWDFRGYTAEPKIRKTARTRIDTCIHMYIMMCIYKYKYYIYIYMCVCGCVCMCTHTHVFAL